MKITPEQVIEEIEHDLAQTVERNYYLRERIEKLEAALREILNTADPYGVECIAREALK